MNAKLIFDAKWRLFSGWCDLRACDPFQASMCKCELSVSFEGLKTVGVFNHRGL